MINIICYHTEIIKYDIDKNFTTFITTHISYYTHIIFIHEYYKKYDFLLILTHTHTDVYTYCIGGNGIS